MTDTTYLTDAIDQLKRERDEARAEVERLRAALRKTADAPCSHCEYSPAHGQRNTAHFIADQVIGASEPGAKA